MKYLFIFAHPDDETVACAGTLRRLAETGEDILVVTVTDGGAGEVSQHVQARLEKFASVGELRRQELDDALKFLGVQNYKVLHFQDGQITNEIVWGQLRSAVIDLIDSYKPDVVITFDHSGWYFHLDHGGVSIATTLAVQQAEFPPAVFFHVHFKVNQSRWSYVFPETQPITHRVNVTDLKEIKLKTLNFHDSQDFHTIKQQLMDPVDHFEAYQLVHSTPAGQQMLKNHSLFVPIDHTQGEV